MSYYVTCSSCVKKFELSEENYQYKLYKQGKTKYYLCEQCNDNIRFSAIKYLFGKGNISFIDNQ